MHRFGQLKHKLQAAPNKRNQQLFLSKRSPLGRKEISSLHQGFMNYCGYSDVDGNVILVTDLRCW